MGNFAVYSREFLDFVFEKFPPKCWLELLRGVHVGVATIVLNQVGHPERSYAGVSPMQCGTQFFETFGMMCLGKRPRHSLMGLLDLYECKRVKASFMLMWQRNDSISREIQKISKGPGNEFICMPIFVDELDII